MTSSNRITFFDYLKSKKNLLIIWFTIHFFALFVNSFKVYVSFYIDRELFKPDYYFYLFTSEPYFLYPPSSSFWPFSHYLNIPGRGYDTFNGIFYGYDISEFIIYSFGILLVLYFIWNANNKK